MLESEIRQTIADSLNLTALSEEDLLEVITELEDNILRRVHLNIATELTAKQNAKLSELITNGQDDEVKQFLVENVPDLSSRIYQVARQTIKEFQNLKEGLR